MDDRRIRIYVSIIFGLGLLVGVRLISRINPIYDFAEPVLSWLDQRSADLTTVKVDELSGFQINQLELQKLQRTNQKLVGRLKNESHNGQVKARVTRRNLVGFRKNVNIDIGLNDGLEVGQVVTTNDYLFGVIDEVFDNSARIKTLLDPNFRATIKVVTCMVF